MLITEVAAGPVSRQNTMELMEDPSNCEGLEAAFLAVKQNVRQSEDGGVKKDTEEDILKRLEWKVDWTGG